MENYKELIANFEDKNKNIALAYGGDGEILNIVRKTNGKRAIIPFRNYGLCEKHLNRFSDFISGVKGQRELKMQRCPFIQWSFQAGTESIIGDRGIAEIMFKNNDITKALRFNVYVNNHLYLKNVICDAGLVSTKYGSTGYFKSVSRCIFNSNSIGVAFIAPTQGVNNLVLDNSNWVKFEFLRSTDITIAADTVCKKLEVNVGDSIEVRELSDAISIFGLDEFHCYECRKKRHSAIEAGVSLQDQYIIL